MRSVVVVRHGERLDYIMRDRGENWIPTTDRPWDPPLTEYGHKQAKDLGEALPGMLEELNLPPIAAVYSSPFWRCRQTSAGLATTDSTLKVQVELGLAESMNQNWYRSWALPGTDGTWGYKKQELPLHEIDKSTLHSAATGPIMEVLDWTKGTTDEPTMARMDTDYNSRTQIDRRVSLEPPIFESFKSQRSRMYETLQLLSADHSNETIVLVSHGGPVTHLYESLTGNNWEKHGVSKYCCYSIYQQKDGEDESAWEPLVVNRQLGETEEKATEEDKTAPSGKGGGFTWA